MSSPTSVNVPKAARIVGLTPPVLYTAIKEGALKAWRPWSKGDLRINLDDLNEWQRGRVQPSATAQG